MESWKKTFYATWTAQLFSIMGFSFVLPFLSLYIKELGGVPDNEVARWAGIAGAATGLSMAICQPIWGAVADRFGRKPMVLRSMFAGAAVLALMPFCRNVSDLIILRTLQGIFTGTMTASIALVSSSSPRERSGYVLGLMQGAVFIGASAGPFFGGYISEHFGFQTAFIVSAFMLFIGGVLVKIYAEENFVRPISLEKPRQSLVTILSTAGFLAAVITLLQVHFANTAVQPVFPLLVEDLLGKPEGAKQVSGMILGAAALAAAIGVPVIGYYSDRWGHKRLLLISTIFAGLVSLPIAFVLSIPELYFWRILFGFAAAAIIPSANAIIRDLVDEKHLGLAYGITASIGCLGWAGGPLVGGFIANYPVFTDSLIWRGLPVQSVGYREPFLLTGIVLLMTSFVVLWGVKTRAEAGGVATEPLPADK